MSYLMPHLPSGWHVDEAIKSEEDRVVVLRFGHDWDTQCMTMDETLAYRTRFMLQVCRCQQLDMQIEPNVSQDLVELREREWLPRPIPPAGVISSLVEVQVSP